MIFVVSRLLILILLNYLVLLGSTSIDVYQLLEDINIIFNIQVQNLDLVNFLICLSISILTLLTIRAFRPFIEIYLLHYTKFIFYLLVCLISISSVFIVYRIYGYSRLSLLIYIFTSASFLLISDKVKNRFPTKKLK